MEDSKINFSDSLNSALQGSMDAYDFLYRKSFPKFEKVVYEYCSNPSDVEDILQEAYIKIFANLQNLQNANNFLAWGSQICRNEAINAGKKKKAKKNDYVLMPDTSEDEEEMGMDEISADTYSSEFNPEARIDADETKRLLDEMTGELTENQRLVICMYKDQYTFKEIAEKLDMPENTVKSHFNRGKKALEAKIKDLEKKGTKLYGMAPFPFFLWVISQFDQHYTPEVSPEYSGSLFGKIVERMPDHTIDVTKSTPNSIDKYGTDSMKQEKDRLHPRRRAENSGSGSANGKNEGSYPKNTNNGPDSTEVRDSKDTLSGEPDGEAYASDHMPSAQESEAGGYTSNLSNAQGAETNGKIAAAGGNAATGAATAGTATAGSGIVTRVIIIAVVAIIGIGGFVGYRFLRNDDDTDTEQTEEPEPDTSAQEDKEAGETREYIAEAEPVMTPQEAADKTSSEIAEAIGIKYIGNEYIDQDTEISQIPDGCVASYAHDFDGDGENEILMAEITKNDNNNLVGIVMYEYEDGEWIETSSRMQDIKSWDSMKEETDSYGNYQGDQKFYYHIVDDTIYESNLSLSYTSVGNALAITYENNSFAEGETIGTCSKKRLFGEGGWCFAGVVFSYYDSDFMHVLQSSEKIEDYVINMVDYTDMSTYTSDDYEFSYPKYFDEIGVQIINGQSNDGKAAVIGELVNDSYFGSGSAELYSISKGDFSNIIATYDYGYDFYSVDDSGFGKTVFYENGDNYWAINDNTNVEMITLEAEARGGLYLSHAYVLALADTWDICYYFHLL